MELHDALVILQEEFEQDHPRAVLIQAMLNFLEKEHVLKGSIGQLERLIVRN